MIVPYGIDFFINKQEKTKMQMNRRTFLGSTVAAGAALAMPGCCCFRGCGCGKERQGEGNLDLKSIQNKKGTK